MTAQQHRDLAKGDLVIHIHSGTIGEVTFTDPGNSRYIEMIFNNKKLWVKRS